VWDLVGSRGREIERWLVQINIVLRDVYLGICKTFCLFPRPKQFNPLGSGYKGRGGRCYLCCIEFAAGDDLLFGSSIGQ
jgi:hypothetical protein